MKEYYIYCFKRGWAILLTIWVISVIFKEDPPPVDKTPHWTNHDPSRHPSEIDYYDYANRRIVYMDPSPYTPKAGPKKTRPTEKVQTIDLDELDEIDYEELIDFYMD